MADLRVTWLNWCVTCAKFTIFNKCGSDSWEFSPDLYMCETTHSCVTWHDSFMCDISQLCKLWMSYFTHICVDLTLRVFARSIYVWNDSFMCDMTHSYVIFLIDFIHGWVISHICVWIWLLRFFLRSLWRGSARCRWARSFEVRDMTHLCVTWLIRVWHDSLMCDMTHSYVTFLIRTSTRHDSSMCDLTYLCMKWLSHVWHDSFICDMTHSYLGKTWLIHVWHDLFVYEMT